jgi:hypothetical protein
LADRIRLIRAFIASPGGLDEERRAARAAAEEVNTTAKLMNYRVELVGWEDTISGAGRPQEIINEELETCELFIGLLWTRWGTPTTTGAGYSSGFEEEFELSRARLSSTGSPEMSMFFRNVSPQQLADPGPELQKVTEFRQQLIESKELLFQHFGDAEEFGSKVRAFLNCYLVSKYKEEVERPTPEQGSASTNSPNGSESLDTESDASGGVEAQVLNQFANSLSGGEAVSPSSLARLRLLAAAISNTKNDEGEIGPHDANLVYAAKASSAFALREIRQLAATGLSNFHFQNAPLWTWLNRLEGLFPDCLGLLSSNGSDAERIGAFRAMGLLAWEPDVDSVYALPNVVLPWLSDGVAEPVRAAALTYLKSHGDSSVLQAITAEFDLGRSGTAVPALEAMLAIQLRIDPDAAVQTALAASFETLDPELVRELLSRWGHLHSADLHRGLDHRSPAVRSRSLTALANIEELPSDIIGRALADVSSDVKAAALRVLFKRGTVKTPEEAASLFPKPTGNLSFLSFSSDKAAEAAIHEVMRERYEVVALDDLKALESTSSTYADLARTELWKRNFGGESPGLRAAIDERFESRLAAEKDRLTPTTFWPTLSILGSPTDPRETRRKELMQAAVDVLATRASEEDLARIRKAIDDGDASPSIATIKFLSRRGNEFAIARLSSKAAPRARGLYAANADDLARLSGKAAIKLAGGNLRRLLSPATPGWFKVAVMRDAPDKNFAALQSNEISALLSDSDEAVRAIAAKKIISAFTGAKAKDVLSSYMQREQRFYNVIFWLDLIVAYPRDLARAVARRAM